MAMLFQVFFEVVRQLSLVSITYYRNRIPAFLSLVLVEPNVKTFIVPGRPRSYEIHISVVVTAVLLL